MNGNNNNTYALPLGNKASSQLPTPSLEQLQTLNFPVPPPMIEGLNLNNVPQAGLQPEAGQILRIVNDQQATGDSIPSHHPIILSQSILHNEIMIPPSADRVYPHYDPRLAQNIGCSLPYRAPAPINPVRFLAPPTNINMYRESCPPRMELFARVVPAEYVAGFGNLHLDVLTDAVWTPNPNDGFPSADSAIQPNICSRCTSPIEVAGPRAVGGPLSIPGSVLCQPNPWPTTLATIAHGVNGPPVTHTGLASCWALELARAARDRSITIRQLQIAAEQAKQTELDDKELEEGLQAQERRINTEFKNED